MRHLYAELYANIHVYIECTTALVCQCLDLCVLYIVHVSYTEQALRLGRVCIVESLCVYVSVCTLHVELLCEYLCVLS